MPAGDSEAIPVVDLFSGIGGLALGVIEGARRAGRRAEIAVAVDVEARPLEVLRHTLALRGNQAKQADIGEVLSASIDARLRNAEKELFRDVPAGAIVVAGPPCQGHSALNNHTRHDDPRNDLYFAVARAAKILDAGAVIVENVRGVGADRRETMRRCADELERQGYFVAEQSLNLHQLGVPQTRTRHVLLASRQSGLDWPLAAVSRTVSWALEDLLDIDPIDPIDIASRPSAVNQDRIDWLFESDSYDLPNELRPACHRSDHSYVSMYGRLHWDAPAQTITSGFGSMGQGRFVHPLRRRTLTPHEAARLQFLPDFVEFGRVRSRVSLAEMIGNAAPPKLTISLISALLKQGHIG